MYATDPSHRATATSRLQGSPALVTGQLRTSGGLTAQLHAPAGATALVVLSHGLYLSHRSWSGVMAGLTGLAEQIAGNRRVAVLAYDHRGHGVNAGLVGNPDSHSDTDPALGLDLLACDLADVLRSAWDFVGQIPTVLVGHSLGSMAGLTALTGQLTSADRDNLVGLTLVSSSAGALTGGMLLRALPVVAGVHPGIYGYGQKLIRAALSPLIGKPAAAGGPGSAACQMSLSALAAAQLLGSLGAYNIIDKLSAALDGLATEVLCGSADRITPVSHSQIIADAAPQARLTVLDGAGHDLPAQAPEQITSAVTRLLAAA